MQILKNNNNRIYENVDINHDDNNVITIINSSNL